MCAEIIIMTSETVTTLEGNCCREKTATTVAGGNINSMINNGNHDHDGGSRGRRRRRRTRGTAFDMGATSMFKRRASSGSEVLAALAGCGDERFCFAVFGLCRRPDPEALRSFLESIASSSPRFRCSLVPRQSADGSLTFEWEDLEGFTVEDVIQQVELPSKSDLDDYLQSRLNGLSYHVGQPQWGVDVITYSDDPDAAHLLSTCNHCVADGITFISLLQALGTERVAAQARNQTDKPSSSKRRRSTGLLGMVKGLVVRAADWVWAIMRVFVINIISGPDGESSLKPRCDPSMAEPGAKRACFLRVRMTDVKTAARRRGYTINDVVMGCLAEGATRYMKEKGDKRLPKTITCRQIIDMRATRGGTISKFDESARFGNGGAYNFAPLDLTPPTVGGKVASAHRFMTYFKRSPEPWLAAWFKSMLLTVLGSVKLASLLIHFTSKVTFQLANLRGPTEEIYIAGCRVHEIFNMNNIGSMMTGVSTTVLGYLDNLTLSLLCNSWAIPDPEVLGKHIKQALLDFCSECNIATI